MDKVTVFMDYNGDVGIKIPVSLVPVVNEAFANFFFSDEVTIDFEDFISGVYMGFLNLPITNVPRKPLGSKD